MKTVIGCCQIPESVSLYQNSDFARKAMKIIKIDLVCYMIESAFVDAKPEWFEAYIDEFFFQIDQYFKFNPISNLNFDYSLRRENQCIELSQYIDLPFNIKSNFEDENRLLEVKKLKEKLKNRFGKKITKNDVVYYPLKYSIEPDKDITLKNIMIFLNQRITAQDFKNIKLIEYESTDQEKRQFLNIELETEIPRKSKFYIFNEYNRFVVKVRTQETDNLLSAKPLVIPVEANVDLIQQMSMDDVSKCSEFLAERFSNFLQNSCNIF